MFKKIEEKIKNLTNPKEIDDVIESYLKSCIEVDEVIPSFDEITREKHEHSLVSQAITSENLNISDIKSSPKAIDLTDKSNISSDLSKQIEIALNGS